MICAAATVNHKQFDEATAILAGDALLTDVCFMCSCASRRLALSAPYPLAHAAGGSGMVGGQALDMLYTGAGGTDCLSQGHARHEDGCAHQRGVSVRRHSCRC